MIYASTSDMPGSPSVYLTFYESSLEEKLLFDRGVILFIHLLRFVKISTNDVDKKNPLLVTEVIKIVFERAVYSNSSDSDTTKASQQNMTRLYLFLRNYLSQIALPPSFALYLPCVHLFHHTWAKLCQGPGMVIDRILGKTGSRNTQHISKQRKAEESTSESSMSQAVSDVQVI